MGLFVYAGRLETATWVVFLRVVDLPPRLEGRPERTSSIRTSLMSRLQTHHQTALNQSGIFVSFNNTRRFHYICIAYVAFAGSSDFSYTYTEKSPCFEITLFLPWRSVNHYDDDFLSTAADTEDIELFWFHNNTLPLIAIKWGKWSFIFIYVE